MLCEVATLSDRVDTSDVKKAACGLLSLDDGAASEVEVVVTGDGEREGN